jgi:DnaJ-class molecular chaperone
MHEEPEDEYLYDVSVSIDTSKQNEIKCIFCAGTGVHPGTMKSLSHRPCPTCQGKGILELKSSRSLYHHCPRCEGSGREPASMIPDPCSTCGGYGIIQ